MIGAAGARLQRAVPAASRLRSCSISTVASGEPGAAEEAAGSRETVQETLRAGLAAEEAAAALFRGQRRVLCDRPDAALFADREEHRLQAVRQLAPAHHVRPSLLSPVLRASFFALGAAAGLAPRNLSAAVGAGVQDALVDVYNEQLRQLRVAGLADVEPEVRHTIMQLRDDERTIEGAPQAPDLLPYLAGSRRLSELTVEEGVAAVVKFGARLSLEITRRI